MHCLHLIITTGLLAASAVQAAPRAVPFAASAANQYDGNPASEVLPRAMEGAALSVRAEEPSACLAPVAVVTTTTVDLTVYVTPSPAPSSPTTSTVSFVPEPVTTPASSETEAALPSCDEGSTFSFFATTTAAPVPASDDDCVIDTAVRPVSTATMTAAVPSSAQPTETQCVHDEPTGAPSESTRYCGIHGTSTDTYFIAAFAENRPGEPVTSEGCYQFCNSALESTEGCQSYRVYENDDGVPSCSLYGGDVAVAVAVLDTSQPDTWYDLACGSPAAEEWHDNMSADHGKRSIEAHR